MAKAQLATDGTLLFWCPGCEEAHGIPVQGPNAWGFNGDLHAPTVTPSILAQFTLYGPERQPFHKYKGPNPPTEKAEGCCHSFVTNGRIQFLGDCTHPLAGQTVDLPDWE